ncbi:hypothetical protein BWQ92_19455 [Arthrobacter sp. QXT-31]|nr:hypothetical protein BWQ92_19455 [Arthrobacter sp. QXT-31]
MSAEHQAGSRQCGHAPAAHTAVRVRSDVMRDQLIEDLGAIPAMLRRTLTWDRGSEMAKHAEVTAAPGTLVSFCDPASPRQRASNENANGLLRQCFRKVSTSVR